MTTSFSEFQEAHSNYSTTKAYKEETWQGVLNLLNSKGWGAYEYLDFVFRKYRKNMVPGLLTSGQVVEEYEEYRSERIIDNIRRAEWALDQVRARLRNGYKVEVILEEKELESYALLLYLIAATDKNEEAMDKLRDAAIYEIRTTPELVDVYTACFSRRLLPDDK